MLIKKLKDVENKLIGKTVLITGAAGGIGLEAAKAFLYLNARIIIVDIDKHKCNMAMNELGSLFTKDHFEICCLDLSNENDILSFVKHIQKVYTCPDVIINNAAIVIIGSVDNLSSNDWDIGYKVNLKAPILLTKYFLPGMKSRNSGVICFIPSSGAAPFMGAYEVYKTAQVEFCNTLCTEIEGTNIYAYSIAPGLVKTQTADQAIEKVSKLMGITKDSIYESNNNNILTTEEAGTAFAVSVLMADKYNGSEIGSIQVLNDFNLLNNPIKSDDHKYIFSDEEKEILFLIKETYQKQYKGWMERNLFERQWLLRDFKKKVGITPEQMEQQLNRLCENIIGNETPIWVNLNEVLGKLKSYYENQYILLQGWEKNIEKLAENSQIIKNWISDIEKVLLASTS